MEDRLKYQIGLNVDIVQTKTTSATLIGGIGWR